MGSGLIAKAMMNTLAGFFISARVCLCFVMYGRQRAEGRGRRTQYWDGNVPYLGVETLHATSLRWAVVRG